MYRIFTPQKLSVMLGITLALSSAHAFAQNADAPEPFQMDSGVWKSFDRYKEEQKQKLIDETTGDPEADAKRIAADEAASDDDNADTKKPQDATAAPPAPVEQHADVKALAPPERPLMPPVMPGLDAEYNLPITSQETPALPVAHIAHIDTEPDLQVPSSNWLDANHVAQLHAEGKDDDDALPAINVRFSFLPSMKNIPAVKVAAVKAPTPPAPKPQVAAADTAACAAIDAYHKQQLEAIRSDRSTLTALQSAITELGLNKQLNFMVGNDVQINSPADPGTSKAGSP